jgi:ribosomal protein S18 acetylase RimI-like enzyme
VRIRQLDLKDFPALLEHDWSPLVRERDTIYLFLARDHGDCCFVAEDERAAPLGYAIGARSSDGESVFLFHVHVRPESRSRGVGSALMRHLERTARDRGVRHIWFLARDGISGFYARLGYNEIRGELPEDVTQYVRSVKASAVMQKELAANRGPEAPAACAKNSGKVV